MKKLILPILILSLAQFSFGQNDITNNNKAIKIKWVDNIKGNFSFKNKWSYADPVDKNEYGQLVCDGLCPPESGTMLDSKRRIKKQYIKAYYKLIDTTHQFHTIQCEAEAPGWSGTDFIEAEQVNKDTVKCYTLCSGGQYSSMHLTIVNDICYPEIEFTNPAPKKGGIYKSSSGFIKIDKNQWKKGIMKAEFNFNFIDPEYPDDIMYCKGKIYTKIKK